MRIIKLSVENFKRLKAIEIEPDGNTVYITGRNAQGKSSILDSIEALFSYPGKKKLPKPIREGEEKAELVAETEEFVVHRSFTQNGTKLVVTNPDGLRYNSPQELLDTFTGALSFDPSEFNKADSKAQVTMLMSALGLQDKLTEIEEQRKEVYEERTEVNRELKTFESRLPNKPPEIVEKVEMAELLDRLEKAERAQKQIDDRKRIIETYTERMANLSVRKTELQIALAQLKKEIDTARQTIEGAEKHLKNIDDPNVHAIKEGISKVDEINSAAAEYETYRSNLKRKKELKVKSNLLTRKIGDLDYEKEKLILETKFPIKGLGFDDEGVKYNDIPISQASDAEQVKVSLAIAMALNPKLRVIRIRNGSLLDAEMRKIVEEMARSEDFDVWIESVSEDEKIGFYIEDGELKSERDQSTAV